MVVQPPTNNACAFNSYGYLFVQPGNACPVPQSCRALDFVFFVERIPTFVVVLRCTTLLLSRLIQGRALRYAIIMAFPDDVGIGGESEQSLDGFTVQSGISTIPLMTLYVSQCSPRVLPCREMSLATSGLLHYISTKQKGLTES